MTQAQDRQRNTYGFGTTLRAPVDVAVEITDPFAMLSIVLNLAFVNAYPLWSAVMIALR